MKKLIFFLRILSLMILSKKPQIKKTLAMTHGVPTQKTNASAGMQSLQWLSVKFHLPPISNCPDHFKQSLLKIPNSSFSWKILISQQCILTTTFNILRVLLIRSILPKNSISFYSLWSFTLLCMQSPWSTSYDDHPPVSMIKLCRTRIKCIKWYD